MANVNVSAPVGAVSILRVVDFALALKNQLVAWNEMRLTRRALSELSDAQLADIGLSRHQTFDI
ncbi:hypothetical protein TRM7557_02526 [Tritonibacter multivorans]|uniref:YjiS-like domain-containing protein n=1 Tax=Tritonibacter multivorans TaxID=928856 RepID=A0A0P1GEL0_9RHOB|nr:DUF1127 domain-containing protein [Tritonibacter multivorans]MDA7420104.1 DUF1127 domain-containing protein [Tritonibacter multivorans]CUH79695.1 hypothetical protein TRM7557_02526 [Tritonibacter multivorans]SFC04409.1 protein of unknown function [Tritonibacter multivorans]